MKQTATMALIVFAFLCTAPTDISNNASAKHEVDSDLLGRDDQIRVRIFPHKRNFPPHFRDGVMDAFTIQSEGLCAAHIANGSNGLSVASEIATARTLSFKATRLRETVWLHCDAPFTLIRPESYRPSYQYRGPIQIKAVSWRGKQILQAVLYLEVEEYLRGVVPAEVIAGWPIETLKAQAVAARTYAVYHMDQARHHARHPDFDVDDSIVFQAYTGLNREHERTNRAIKETTGEILVHNGNVIQAYYHADSGGRTASGKSIFDMEIPYCASREEPYSYELRTSTWTLKLNLPQLNDKFVALGTIDKANPIVDVIMSSVERTKSGRVKEISVHLQDGRQQSISIAQWKRTIALKSSMFEVGVENPAQAKVITFTGRGSGHGVGLNQTGAKILAEHYSWTYDRILKFYYAGVEVCSLQPNAGVADLAQCETRRET